MRLFVVAAALLIAGPTVGLESFPRLLDVISEIEGREVQATGLIGNFEQFGPEIRIEDRSFALTYALPRDQLAKAEACKFEIFSTENACMAKITAEIKINKSDVELIVFDVNFLP